MNGTCMVCEIRTTGLDIVTVRWLRLDLKARHRKSHEQVPAWVPGIQAGLGYCNLEQTLVGRHKLRLKRSIVLYSLADRLPSC